MKFLVLLWSMLFLIGTPEKVDPLPTTHPEKFAVYRPPVVVVSYPLDSQSILSSQDVPVTSGVSHMIQPYAGPCTTNSTGYTNETFICLEDGRWQGSDVERNSAGDANGSKYAVTYLCRAGMEPVRVSSHQGVARPPQVLCTSIHQWVNGQPRLVWSQIIGAQFDESAQRARSGS